MKKKIIIVLCLIAVFLMLHQSASAQYDRVNLAMTFGTVTDDSFSFSPFLWTAGLNLDFWISESFIISPECHIINSGFDFGAFILAPSVLFNMDLGGFIIGGGVTKYFLIGSEISGAPASDFALKLNTGYIGEGIRLTVFLVTSFSSLFSSNTLGANLGFYF
ncbi:hypothetical protein ACFLT9_11675 [Acidobacteriota bacterium]